MTVRKPAFYCFLVLLLLALLPARGDTPAEILKLAAGYQAFSDQDLQRAAACHATQLAGLERTQAVLNARSWGALSDDALHIMQAGSLAHFAGLTRDETIAASAGWRVYGNRDLKVVRAWLLAQLAGRHIEQSMLGAGSWSKMPVRDAAVTATYCIATWAGLTYDEAMAESRGWGALSRGDLEIAKTYLLARLAAISETNTTILLWHESATTAYSTIHEACAAAVGGDKVIVSSGTYNYDVGNTAPAIVVPDGASLVGVGRPTIVFAETTYCGIYLMPNTTVSGFNLDGRNRDEVRKQICIGFNWAFGWYDAVRDYTNVVLRNVDACSGSDAIFFGPAGETEITEYYCNALSTCDPHVMVNKAVSNYNNCKWTLWKCTSVATTNSVGPSSYNYTHALGIDELNGHFAIQEVFVNGGFYAATNLPSNGAGNVFLFTSVGSESNPKLFQAVGVTAVSDAKYVFYGDMWDSGVALFYDCTLSGLMHVEDGAGSGNAAPVLRTGLTTNMFLRVPE